MSKFVEIPGRRMCKKCRHNKKLEYFKIYKRKDKAILGHTCLECARKLANEQHKRRMQDPTKREKRNQRIAKTKYTKYHTDQEYREKKKVESKNYYEKNKEEINKFQRRKYRVVKEIRERECARARLSKLKESADQADQYTNLYAFFSV